MKTVTIEIGGATADMGPGDESESLFTSYTSLKVENSLGFDLPQIDIEGEHLADVLAALGHAMEQATDSKGLQLAATLIQQAGDLVKEHLAAEVATGTIV